MAHRIVLKDVDAGYGAVRVLHRVCLEVREGETVVLLGTNGNGKSTVMKCLMGLVQVDAGEVFLETDGQRDPATAAAPVGRQHERWGAADAGRGPRPHVRP